VLPIMVMTGSGSTLPWCGSATLVYGLCYLWKWWRDPDPHLSDADPHPWLTKRVTVTYEDDDGLVDELVRLAAGAVHAVRLVGQHLPLQQESTAPGI
jgi:hypothetical protein